MLVTRKIFYAIRERVIVGAMEVDSYEWSVKFFRYI